MDKSMNTIKLKKINKQKVYEFIYNEKTTCKLDICKGLEMGLSTVAQNLKILEEEGLINKRGFLNSTGGRKADAIEITKNARISIGIGILKQSFDIVAVNLYGETIFSKTIKLKYAEKKSYYKKIGLFIEDFILKENLDKEKILGVSIGVQGIVSNDGKSVIYGEILGNYKMKLSDFSEFINFPCRIEHDSKSAGRLELWENKTVENAIIFLLNNNLGGSIISNKVIQNGENMRAGVIEHIIINPEGDLCYCGQKGCLETFCSANALVKSANMDIVDFFGSLEKNNKKSKKIWHNYLDKLAFSIANLNLVIDGKIIITGIVSWFFKEDDIIYLLDKINSNTIFTFTRNDIIVSKNGKFAQSVGSALFYIEDFLKNIY